MEPAAEQSKLGHFLSVDVESACQATNLAPYFSTRNHPAQSAALRARVSPNLQNILALFAEHQVKATFFVCGNLQTELSDRLDSIRESGHIVASHGYAHENLRSLSFDTWRKDVEKSVKTLAPWLPAKGDRAYRAPDFSLPFWKADYYKALADMGFSSSSSVMAARVPRAEWQRLSKTKKTSLLAGKPFEVLDGGVALREFPIPSFRFLSVPLAFGGGFWLRVFPFTWNQFHMRRCQHQNRSFHLYLHPWEVDTEQEKLPIPLLRRLRQYAGVNGLPKRVARVLDEFAFRPLP